jgi:hypothetical protein
MDLYIICGLSSLSRTPEVSQLLQIDDPATWIFLEVICAIKRMPEVTRAPHPALGLSLWLTQLVSIAD